MKHLPPGISNLALCVFNSMKTFRQHLCTCLHNKLLLFFSNSFVDRLYIFISKKSIHLCDSHLNMHNLRNNPLPFWRKESTSHRLNLYQNPW